MPLKENDVIDLIREHLPGGETLTDDCGAVPSPDPGQRLLVTTDVMEEAQHFHRDWHPPRMLGRKLLNVNLSDLDASGARPLGFTLTLSLPPDLDMPWLEAFVEGLEEVSRATGLVVIGGDTVGRPAGLGLSITAFGSAARWLRRDGLLPGDGIYVDQPLGASLRGLRKLQAGQRWDPEHPDPDLWAHLDPRPNLGLGVRLAAMAEVHACIDLSDGLSRDLRMMAEASGLSIVLAKDLDPDDVTGGEDYARCFGSSLPQDALEARLGLPLQRVGVARARSEAPLLAYDGDRLGPAPDRSFDHFSQAR